MKLLFFLFAFVPFFSSFASATNFRSENQIRVIFNNGVALPDMSCSTSDMAKILKALDVPIRHLRQAKDNENEKNHQTARRQLQSFTPPKCKETCKGFATGTCVAQACKGYRRELDEDAETTEGLEEGRELFFDSNTFWCDWGLRLGNSALNKLVSFRSISDSCQSLLKAPRTMQCLTVAC